MHILNCLVAIGGDVSNKAYRTNVTVPEMQLLGIIHGPGSINEIKVLGVKKIDQLEERDRLIRLYPKHAQQVIGMWRDNGSTFHNDVRKIRFLSAAQFATNIAAAHEDADKIEEQLVDAVEAGAPAPLLDIELGDMPEIEEDVVNQASVV
jgi:hypothetical protein